MSRIIYFFIQVYPLSFVESFAFGSLISAVDPVATLAIFQALDVEPVLNMLVSLLLFFCWVEFTVVF
jgi:NhaP-type Na+/H+ or K+/H+ antiporter